MTRDDYDMATARLSAIWPTYAPDPETDDAWFDLLSDMSAPLFIECLALAVRREEWRPWSSLPAMVNRYEDEARRRIMDRLDLARHENSRKLLQIPESERRKNLLMVRLLLKKIGSSFTKGD